MATVSWTNQDQFRDLNLFLWTTLTTTNLDGQACTYHGTGDRTVQVDGTFGAGATVTLQGSNDPLGTTPVNWFPMTFVGGAAATFTTAGGAGIKLLAECPAAIRPLLSGGDGTTSLNVRLGIRRNNANG